MTAVGSWTLTMKTPMGDQVGTLTIVETDGKLSGTLAQSADDFVEISDANETGNVVKFKVPVKKPIPLNLHFELTVDGDTIDGKFRPGMFPPSPASGVRIL